MPAALWYYLSGAEIETDGGSSPGMIPLSFPSRTRPGQRAGDDDPVVAGEHPGEAGETDTACADHLDRGSQETLSWRKPDSNRWSLL